MSRFGPFFALALSVGIFLVYIQPTYNGPVADAQSAIAGDNQALAAIAAYTSKENELENAKKSIDPTNLTRLANYLPDSVNNVQTIIDLNALAARTGVSLTDFSITTADTGQTNTTGAASPAQITGSVDITLSITGSYQNFLSFLTTVEHSARLMEITNLVVNGSDTGVYTYSLKLRLYWLR